jgi:hypothetical protein
MEEMAADAREKGARALAGMKRSEGKRAALPAAAYTFTRSARNAVNAIYCEDHFAPDLIV